MEIERKFLLETNEWREYITNAARDIKQVYLLNVPEGTVRIGASTLRTQKQIQEQKDPQRKGYITIKIPREGMVRDETEFELDPILAHEIIAYAIKNGFPYIRKTRYYIHDINDLVWEIDEFLGRENYKIIMAEIELPNENYDLIIPPWVGPEVTNDPKFYNAFLAETTEAPKVSDVAPEVEENFIKNWSFLLNSDGSINVEQLKLELSDFSHLINEIPKVYDHITGGLLSKHMYLANTICGAADKHYWQMHRDIILDDIREMTDIQEVIEYLKS